MGHWTPTGIEPMDYDDDGDEGSVSFDVSGCIVSAMQYILAKEANDNFVL